LQNVFDLLIDAKHFRPFCIELWIAAFQIITDLIWF
ncbi:hypothetical protein PPOP_3869, partial [Paenibacillus popilliae ATCC 14706]